MDKRFNKTIGVQHEGTVLVPHYSMELSTMIWIEVREENDRGNSITRESGGDTEEGWSSSSDQWWMDAEGIVHCENNTDGCDCDGRMSTHWEGVWNMNTQQWERVSSGQRDYTAESMGY